ncbi:MAG TPA: hypothetical protein VK507_05325, partial [Iamia sp.]|nr:hypothetical protein [Iamia sp.]
MTGREGWGVEDWVPRTKLLRPEVPAGVAIEPGLLGATARTIAATPVTLVSGQAGAGKTTLVAAAVAHTGLPVAWASLDPGDDDLASLLHLLASAIETVVPDGCTGGRELLRADRPAAADPRRAAGVLVNDLLAVEPPLFVLVVDDAHVLTAAGAAPLLDGLLAQLPPFLRVVLTARDEPAVALSRLRATRRLADIGGDDLRLDVAQAEAALNDDIGLGLPPDAVAAVVEAVNGWATGVHLLGRSLARHDHGDRAAAGIDPDALYDYLADEVLGDEPADVLALLEDVAVLPVVTAEAARRLSGRDDAGEILAELARRLHFLVLTVDRSTGVFRLHELVRSFLLRRLASADAAGLADRHRRAADVVDDPAARIDHLIAAGDWEVAADAVEAAARAVAPRAGDLARVAAWAERIPVQRPWLALARGVAAVGRGDRTGVIELLGPLVTDEGFDDLLGRWLAARTVHMATLDHARWA